jgi:hypothetical protein
MNPYDNARRQTDWATAVRRVGRHAERAGANWHGRQLCPRSPLVTGVPSSHHGSDEQMLAPRTRRSPCDLRPAAAGGAGGWESLHFLDNHSGDMMQERERKRASPSAISGKRRVKSLPGRL